MNKSEFIDEKNFSDIPIIFMPILIVLAAFEISLVVEGNVDFTNTIFTIGLLIAIVVDFVLILRISFYKIVGTNRRLYIMKFAKTEIVDLADIKNVSFAQNQKGFYDYSICANDKIYQLIINKRREFTEYLKENVKKGSDDEQVEEKKLAAIMIMSKILFIVSINSLSISFFCFENIISKLL